jgi:cell division GTPase FtsZ
MTDKKVAIIGVGNCGSQVAYLAEKKYGDLIDCVYINTSDADLAMVNTDNSIKFKVGEKDEVEGSGKNRLKMKEYFRKDIPNILSQEQFTDMMNDKKYVFIVTSSAGGTGSGAGPVLLDILRHGFIDTHFILIGVLPQLDASLMEQGNTIEFLNELYEDLGDKTTYMIYDNETTADRSPTEALEIVNENIVEDIRVLTGIDNFATPYESIDEADMESIITTPGRLLVVRLKKGITEKVMEDTCLDDMIIKAIKQSCHTETDRNKKVVRWGIITYFTDTVNRLYSSKLEHLRDFIGTPIERFNHNAINIGYENLNFLYMIASGMSPINDRVKKITDRIDELKAALAKDDASRYILSGEGVSYDVLEARRKEERQIYMDENIKPDDLFKKFMK